MNASPYRTPKLVKPHEIHLIPRDEEGHEESKNCGCQPVLENEKGWLEGLDDEPLYRHRARHECAN